jgi:hypothetical protein
MLAGRVPFLKDSDEATLALLQKGPAVKFAGARWRGISDVRPLLGCFWAAFVFLALRVLCFCACSARSLTAKPRP